MVPFASLKKQAETLFRLICRERKTLFQLKKTSWKKRRIIREANGPSIDKEANPSAHAEVKFCKISWGAELLICVPFDVSVAYLFCVICTNCKAINWAHCATYRSQIILHPCLFQLILDTSIFYMPDFFGQHVILSLFDLTIYRKKKLWVVFWIVKNCCLEIQLPKI